MTTENSNSSEPAITEDAVSNALVTNAKRFRRNLQFNRRFGIAFSIIALLLLAFGLFGVRPTIVAYENWRADMALADDDVLAATVHQSIAWSYEHVPLARGNAYLMFLPSQVDRSEGKPDRASCTQALNEQQALLDMQPPTLVRSALYSAWAICQESAQQPTIAYNDYLLSAASASGARTRAFQLLISANRAALSNDPTTARRLVAAAAATEPLLVTNVAKRGLSPHPYYVFPALAPILVGYAPPPRTSAR